ncbi:MAG: arginine deiminase-related protein [Flavobacteriales bacterium]|nr:arginine deiminase-related protein [Flavobacteriales bacterium]
MNIQSLLMIRPAHFGFNEETAASNVFQQRIAEDVKLAARKEFDEFVNTLQSHNIPVTVFDDVPGTLLPDSVFPNNWFSTHPDGSLYLYPMLTESRKAEVRKDVPEYLKQHFRYTSVLDFRNEHGVCEGTGSLVFDHENKLAYAVLSERTDKKLSEKIIQSLGYSPVFLEAFRHGKPIYHTNVVLFNTPEFLGYCPGVLTEESRRKISSLLPEGKETLEITEDQMYAFAGNMLSVDCEAGRFLIMSETAKNALQISQLEYIKSKRQPVVVSIPTTEKVGGGSARCMMAEVY